MGKVSVEQNFKQYQRKDIMWFDKKTLKKRVRSYLRRIYYTTLHSDEPNEYTFARYIRRQSNEVAYKFEGTNHYSDWEIYKDRQYDYAYIVFNPSPRIIKIVNALINQNKKLVLFIDNSMLSLSYGSLYRSEIESLNTDVIYFKKTKKLLTCLTSLNAKLLHIFCCPERLYGARIVFLIKDKLPHIVFENYDIVNSFYTGFSSDQLEIERFMFENADGVCCRSYEIDYLINKKGWKVNRLVHFFDYCCNKLDEIVCESKRGLSLCHAGTLYVEKDQPDNCFSATLELSRLCKQNECHLHIYPTIWDEQKYSELLSEMNDNNYLHVHKPVPYDRLISEISKYDYGIVMVNGSYRESNKNDSFFFEKLVWAGTNKFFDYIDAGLPIISPVPEKFLQLFIERGVALPWTVSEYDFDYLRENKEMLKEKTKEARSFFDIKKHVIELMNFYEAIYGKQ
jgi:hypothetical protein